MLVSDILNPTAGAVEYYMYANANYTKTNYWYQYLLADSTSVSGARANLPNFSYSPANKMTQSICNIKLTNSGYATYQSNNAIQYGTVSIGIIKYYTTSTFTLTSITSLSIQSSVANAIGIGSRFTLYKMR